ncbi:uncharacterized protein ACR2FA_009157 [Aphomia sociella]
MSYLKSYRACFVPLCTNNTKRTPHKMFLNVPQNAERRDKWFQAVRRINPNTTSNFFCCEDHFDLREDMENYIYYTIMGGGNAKIKVGVVPHKFACQTNRKRQGNMTPRPAAEKRRRQRKKQELLKESSKSIDVINPQEFDIQTTSVHIVNCIEVHYSPSSTMSNEKVSVETRTGIKNRSFTVELAFIDRLSLIIKMMILIVKNSDACTNKILLLSWTYFNIMTSQTRRPIDGWIHAIIVKKNHLLFYNSLKKYINKIDVFLLKHPIRIFKLY